jgi:hypothetical protein
MMLLRIAGRQLKHFCRFCRLLPGSDLRWLCRGPFLRLMAVTLLPFIWSEASRRGQIFGNQTKGSIVSVSNGKKFSYPGYNEILTGHGDPRIDSNDKKPNPNETVFEWLNTRPSLRGRVSVFGTWDVFPYIFNIERSRLPIWPSWDAEFEKSQINISEVVTDIVRDTTPMWEDLTYDSFLFHAATEHVQRKHPRVVFLHQNGQPGLF